eukprot:409850-Pleurochrysis_carterae.AAC.2
MVFFKARTETDWLGDEQAASRGRYGAEERAAGRVLEQGGWKMGTWGRVVHLGRFVLVAAAS